MAFINTPKSFSKESLPSAKTAKDIEPFIDYVNQNFDQIQRALINQLTISENLKGQVVTVQAKHNQAVAVNTAAPVRYGFVLAADDGVTSFKFSNLSNGQLTCTFHFESPIPVQAKRQVNSTGDLLGIYQCTNIGGIHIGDRITFSGFGAASNNGEALILGLIKDSGAPAIVCVKYPPVVQESMPSFVGESESFKSVTVALLY